MDCACVPQTCGLWDPTVWSNTYFEVYCLPSLRRRPFKNISICHSYSPSQSRLHRCFGFLPLTYWNYKLSNYTSLVVLVHILPTVLSSYLLVLPQIAIQSSILPNLTTSLLLSTPPQHSIQGPQTSVLISYFPWDCLHSLNKLIWQFLLNPMRMGLNSQLSFQTLHFPLPAASIHFIVQFTSMYWPFLSMKHVFIKTMKIAEVL